MISSGRLINESKVEITTIAATSAGPAGTRLANRKLNTATGMEA